MTTIEKKLNRDLIVGWSVIVVVLFITYIIEVLKGERTVSYVIIFSIVTGVPALICGLIFKKDPLNKLLRYYIVVGYFIMYLFVMCSGSTTLVFTYILPLLSILILYHQPRLILWTGIVTLAINAVFIGIRVSNHLITLSNSKDVEIQIALLVLCFCGCYAATRLYDEIQTRNNEYISEIDEKSKQIQRMTLQTIETIANTIDAKDEYTKGHSRRVSEYAARIAEELNMSEEEIMNIRYIALLHDIGKIGVPDAVLNKPGRLTDTEYELMKKHTVIGGEILKDIRMLPDLDVGAKYHHERYDGKGYPNGLKGEEIPKTARVICLADAYDAMTSNRIYRRHLSKEEVFDEIKRCSGTQFDPDIAKVFLNYLETAPDWVIREDNDIQDETLGEASNRLLQRIMVDSHKQSQKMSELDSLTGVYNRSTGERKIVAAMRDHFGCMIVLNVDNMRQVNRKYGFRRGDYYLKMLAKFMTKVSPEIIVSRFGGNEFLCFIPDVIDTDTIRGIMDGFMSQIQEYTDIEGILSDFSVSAGITIYDSQNVKLQHLMMEADKALYHVKQSKRNTYYFYSQVADWNDDITKVDWNKVMRVSRGRDLIDMHDASKNGKHSRLVMFTAMIENENSMTIEEREDVMRIIEYAIFNTLKNDHVITKYSSVQRVVMVSGDHYDAIKKLTELILIHFYKMYDKNDVELYYDIANADL
jgi:diguanylate cyclase (GGDEF)-like protein